MPTITDWITALTTIILAVITGYYAIVTHRILKYQKDITELELRPFLKMETIIVNFYVNRKNKEDIESIQLGVRLKNPSRVLLKYKINSIIASIEKATIDNPRFENDGGYVYPDQITDFTYEAINDFDKSKEVLCAEIKYELEYYSTEKKKYKSIRHYKVNIFLGEKNNPKWQWKSIKEEEYEVQ